MGGIKMELNVHNLVDCIRTKCAGISDDYAKSYAEELLADLDPRLTSNLMEWMEGKEISDVWIGKYCINAIMSIRGDRDFLGALKAMNTYLHDEEAEKTMNNKMEMNCRHAKEERKLMIPKGQFHSDWFECSKCGYEVRVLTLSNQIKCSECGGTMYRK